MTTTSKQNQPKSTKQPKATNASSLEIAGYSSKENNSNTSIVMLPISSLCCSTQNVRKSKPSSTDDKALYASILAHGIIQNLVSLPINNEKKYPIVGGGRRLTQLNKLVKKGELQNDDMVPVKILTKQEAGDFASEISLSENFIRTNMHPVDEFKAFANMLKSGASSSEVSKRFGVTEKFVHQRLKLSLVAPCILKAYQEGDITLDIVMAFTIADVKQQKNVWEEIKDRYYLSASNIKSELKNEAMESTHYIAEFVGRTAYEKAGGAVTGDLFSDKVYFDDAKLINDLATAKLEIEADKLTKQGWGWVKVFLSRTFQETNGYTLLVSNKGQYKKAEKAIAGCVVVLERDGSLYQAKGLVAKTEQKQLKQLQATNTSIDEVAIDEVTTVEEDSYSCALNDDLRANRLVITKHALMTNPTLAIDAMNYSICLETFVKEAYIEQPVNVSIKDTSFAPKTGDFSENKALGLIEQHKEKFDLTWLAKDSDKSKFEAFCQLDDAEKQKQIAYASAMMLQASLMGDRQWDAVENIIDTLGVDFSSYWRPTATNFLKRISVPQLINIAKPVMDDQWIGQAGKLKKKDLAEQIDGLINGEGAELNEKQRNHFKKWMPKGF